MSSNNNERERRKSFFALSEAAGAFVIAITLLTAAGGFALINPTPMTDALAQEENNNNNTTGAATPSNSTTTTTSASSGIELSPQPVYQEEVRDVSETLINQTHAQLIVSGNGTLTLPNSTESIIRTTSTGSGIVSIMGTFSAKEILTTEDGSENATATFYEIARSNKEEGIGKGIAIAVFHTNSTGKLAPLDGMILAGQEEIQPDGTGLTTLWEWQSGIPSVEMQLLMMQ